MVKRLEEDLLELVPFFGFSRPLWRKLHTIHVTKLCFVEVQRPTRPRVCFVNVASVDRIIYAIFNGINEKSQWENRPPPFRTGSLTAPDPELRLPW